MCEELILPDNGGVLYNSVAVNDTGVLRYDLQTIASFVCTEGFVLSGPQERVCTADQGSGVWTGNKTVCEGIMFYIVKNAVCTIGQIYLASFYDHGYTFCYKGIVYTFYFVGVHNV